MLIVDNFSGGYGALDGETVSGGGFTWADGEGSGLIDTSAVCNGNQATTWGTGYISDMPDLTAVTIKVVYKSGTAVSVIGMYDPTAGDGTGYTFSIAGAGHDTLAIKEISNGLANNTDLDTLTLVINADDVIVFVLGASSQEVFVNGVSKLSATDGTYTSGKAGIGVFDKRGTVDDLEITAASPAGGQGQAAQWGARWGFSRGGF